MLAKIIHFNSSSLAFITNYDIVLSSYKGLLKHLSTVRTHVAAVYTDNKYNNRKERIQDVHY